MASSTPAEYRDHLRLIFSRLQAHGLVINCSKCEFGVTSINFFLCHHIDQHNVSPLPDRVTAIRNFPQPITVIGMQEFLGMNNFFQMVYPQSVVIMRPIYASTKGKAKLVTWFEDMVNPFSLVKPSLATATLLVHLRLFPLHLSLWMPLTLPLVEFWNNSLMISGDHLHFLADNYILRKLGIVPLTMNVWCYTSQFSIFAIF